VTPSISPSFSPSSSPSVLPSLAPTLTPSFVPSRAPIPYSLVSDVYHTGDTDVMHPDGDYFVRGSINDENTATFDSFEVDNSNDVMTGSADIVTTFTIISISLGLADDKRTVAFGASGADESLVCFYKFKKNKWSQFGTCVATILTASPTESP